MAHQGYRRNLRGQLAHSDSESETELTRSRLYHDPNTITAHMVQQPMQQMPQMPQMQPMMQPMVQPMVQPMSMSMTPAAGMIQPMQPMMTGAPTPMMPMGVPTPMMTATPAPNQQQMMPMAPMQPMASGQVMPQQAAAMQQPNMHPPYAIDPNIQHQQNLQVDRCLPARARRSCFAVFVSSVSSVSPETFVRTIRPRRISCFVTLSCLEYRFCQYSQNRTHSTHARSRP